MSLLLVENKFLIIDGENIAGQEYYRQRKRWHDMDIDAFVLKKIKLRSL